MSKHDFFHSTPNDIYLFIDEHDKRYKAEAEAEFERIKYSSWLSGLYVQVAVASVLSKKTKYPKHPYGDEESENIVINATEDMSEEAKSAARNALLESLIGMQRDFEKFQNKQGSTEVGE